MSLKDGFTPKSLYTYLFVMMMIIVLFTVPPGLDFK